MTPLGFAVVFGAGVASFASPCVLPLVPAYLGMVSDRTTGDTARAGLVSGTLWFCAGLAAVLVILGSAFAQAGSSLSGLVDPLRIVGGVLVVVFGLTKLGVGGRLTQRLGARSRPGLLLPGVGGPFRPFVLGVAFATAWSPCVGPVLGAVLLTAADGRTALQGAALLGVYALGLSLPFVGGALAVESVPGGLARLRRAMRPLERVVGVALVVLGLLLAFDVFGDVLSRAAGPVNQLVG